MHECPACYMACDCDGEDIWHSWPSSAVEERDHQCDFHDDDEEPIDDPTD